ncbi:unnamed protein product [Caenorhabditis auriculariae]|uniref:G-protein coupled receptors family 1 profile domain-containing protein n=1 Tax=Caenorhabditis auriculariae TaxID=2777116 RepID=A0A8S1HDJ1_9PELO|nr:unnamed protein product [Caenorhabditis auriculariae]
MMPAILLLITDLVTLALQITCATINGLVIALFFWKRSLRVKTNQRLILYLAITDFILAITSLPYVFYLLSGWDWYEMDYEPLAILILSTPLPAQLKINLTLTSAIAFDRNLALYRPVWYRKRVGNCFANAALFFGVALAATDITFGFAMSSRARVANCAAVGCFLGQTFRTFGASPTCYWAYTPSYQPTDRPRYYNQANRITVAILTSCLVCITFPSFIIGAFDLAGVCNSIIYVVVNEEVRKAAREVFSKVLPPGIEPYTINRSNISTLQ